MLLESRDQKNVLKDEPKHKPGELKHSANEKSKNSEEFQIQDQVMKTTTAATKEKSIHLSPITNSITDPIKIQSDEDTNIKQTSSENKPKILSTEEACNSIPNVYSPYVVKKIFVNKDVHSAQPEIKRETEEGTTSKKNDILGLDNEAIRLSNEIFNFSNVDEEEIESKNICVKSKPKHTFVKTSSKPQIDHSSQGALDHEAIRLSNEIFSETTKMSPEELQMNDCLYQPKTLEGSKNDLVKPAKETIPEVEPKKETQGNHIQHARQCFVVNQPIKDETKVPPFTNVNETSGKKSCSEAEIQPHVSKYDNTDLNCALRGTRFKSNDYKHDVHMNRPLYLGPSRFDDPDNFKLTPSPSIPNLKTAGNHELQRPVRNATFADLSISKSDLVDMPSLAASSSFAFESSKSVSPKHTRKAFDRNFNVSPAPFLSGKYSVHFSEPHASLLSKTSSQFGSSSMWSKNGSVTLSNNHSSHSTSSLLNSSSQPSHSKYQSFSPPTSKHSKGEFRAKSEGSGQTYSVTKPANSISADLLRQIQVTKERHRENCEKALSFEKTQSRPPTYKDKLPRPGNDYARYNTLEREKLARRQEREKTVIDKVMAERAGRATSLENKYRI